MASLDWFWLVGFWRAHYYILWDLRSYTLSTTSQPFRSQLSKLHFTENLHVLKVFCWQDLFCDVWLQFLVVFGSNLRCSGRDWTTMSASETMWTANKVFSTVQENKKSGFDWNNVNVKSFEIQQIIIIDLIGKCNCEHAFWQINVWRLWHFYPSYYWVLDLN